MTRLAGRCYCGVAFAVFTRRDWELHLRCFGVRWCRRCGDAARFAGDCPGCARARSRRYYANLATKNPAQYERARRLDKARKRRKYKLDPIWRDSKLARQRASRALGQHDDYNAYRREWRRGQVGTGPLVSCGCGCGATFTTYNAEGRPRRFLPGHHRRVLVQTQREAA